jgi:restriction system protein
MTVAIPSYDAFLWPILERLRFKGGAMTNQEMVDDVAVAMGLTDEQQSEPHGETGRTEVEYRMSWARVYLKKAELLESSERGVWRLTLRGNEVRSRDVTSILKSIRLGARQALLGTNIPVKREKPDLPDNTGEGESWMEDLIERLLDISPGGFERLCQRLLRESGFTKVEVTGQSSDGGIDGTGVLRVNLISFHVLFQAKRYRGPVGSGAIRDFRGAMVGRASQGLIITTGSFTADARREAVRDGAPAIDLVDGEALAVLLKDLRIGVVVRLVEEVSLNLDAFDEFT